jgi:hypothetical protein
LTNYLLPRYTVTNPEERRTFLVWRIFLQQQYGFFTLLAWAISLAPAFFAAEKHQTDG